MRKCNIRTITVLCALLMSFSVPNRIILNLFLMCDGDLTETRQHVN